jgi:hypothetical protein
MRNQILSSFLLIVLGIGAIAMAKKDERYSDAPSGLERGIYLVVGILMLVGGVTLVAPVIHALAQ